MLQAAWEVWVRNYFCLKHFSPSALFKTRGLLQSPSGSVAQRLLCALVWRARGAPTLPSLHPSISPSLHPPIHTANPNSRKTPWHWWVLTLGTLNICPKFSHCLSGLQMSAGVSIALCFRWSWIQIYTKVTSGKCNMKLDQGSVCFYLFFFFLFRKKLPARSIMLFLEKSLILGCSVSVRRTKCLLHHGDWVVYTDMNLHLLSQKDVQDYFLTGS